MQRRELLENMLLAAGARQPAGPATGKLGMPGPYPGRVVEVHHPGALASVAYQLEPVKKMMQKGMTELTGAPGWADAWRVFAEPGDVVGIKVSAVGGRRLCSDAVVMNLIIDGLKQAGVKARDIVVCNRYRDEIVGAGIHKWLPDGVRYTWAVQRYDPIQVATHGYDTDVYMEMALVQPGQDPFNPLFRRSHVAKFLTREMNKFVNLPVLKHHQSAGVTLALKNFTFGMCNNVARSHQGGTMKLLNHGNIFIPALADLPVFRQKAVLHILDGIKGTYEDGPGANPKFMFEYNTMWFATDPVAMDKQGWKVIDAKRTENGLKKLAEASQYRGNLLRFTPEHIELAGLLGLGVWDDAKIELKKFDLT